MRLGKTLAAAALALAATGAHATNGIRMIGFGPVQDAMGGAAVGAPLDAATLITNPAGLAAVGGRVDVGGAVIGGDVLYRATGALPGVASGAEQRSDRRPIALPAAGLVVPVDDRLTAAVGVYGVAGLGVDYPQDLFGSKTYTSYAQVRFAPAASYRILPNLSVGAALNLMYSTLEYSLSGGMGSPPRDMGVAYGIGATVGLHWQATEALAFGLAYETRSRFQDFAFNVPAHQAVVGIDATGAPITAAFPGGVEELEFDQPSQATLGVGLRPLPSLLLAADLAWIGWSETFGRGAPRLLSDPALTGGRPLDLHWSDQWVVKVGAEWSPASSLALRAGWNYGAHPLDRSRALENLILPALAEHHFTVGAGIGLGKATIQLAAMYAPEVALEAALPGAPQLLAGYRTRVTELAVDAGLSYRF